MRRRRRKIGQKVNILLLSMVAVVMGLSCGVSLYSLATMQNISSESNQELGRTAASDTELALEEQAVAHLQSIAVERASYIEERFATVEAYVQGIATLATDIYAHPEQYPDRVVALPIRNSKQLAAQLLWSKRLVTEGQDVDVSGAPVATEELLKLGNVQDLLVQYNAQSDMVSSAYIATESGWMIQADYIAYSKYAEADEEAALPFFYEASEREWYQGAKAKMPGEMIYTDILMDVHQGEECIVCASPVYCQGKVVAVAGVGSYLRTVKEAVLHTNISESGYAFLINDKGQILVAGKEEGEIAQYAQAQMDLRESDNIALADAVNRMMEGDSGSVKLTLDGRDRYLAYAPLERFGWSLVTVMDVAEVIAPALESEEEILALTETVTIRQEETIQRMLFSFVIGMVLVAVLVGLAGTLFSRRLTEPICTLTEAVAGMDAGNLNYRLQLHTGDEIEDLNNAFRGMAKQLQSYIANLAKITAEKERIRTEIAVASRLQADMLPNAEVSFPNRRDFRLAASMTPAKGVGGDFYDFFLLEEDKLVLVMADVSGKGVPAALFMVEARTLMRSCLLSVRREEQSIEQWLARAVEEVNANLCANNPNGMFVTAWIGVLHLTLGDLFYVNAGHCPLLLCHTDGTCEYITALSGLVLGLEQMTYRAFGVRLRQGESLLLYTDGVTEATNAEGELYGEERLFHTIQNGGKAEASPKMLLQKVQQDVDAFQEAVEPFDDMTLLAVTYYGVEQTEKSGVPQVEQMGEFAEFVEGILQAKGVLRPTIAQVLLAFDEIFSNICYYSGASEVTVSVQVKESPLEEKTIILGFADNGIPYNPLDRQEPASGNPTKAGGWGIRLVKEGMDECQYAYRDMQNWLTLVKREERIRLC